MGPVIGFMKTLVILAISLQLSFGCLELESTIAVKKCLEDKTFDAVQHTMTAERGSVMDYLFNIDFVKLADLHARSVFRMKGRRYVFLTPPKSDVEFFNSEDVPGSREVQFRMLIPKMVTEGECELDIENQPGYYLGTCTQTYKNIKVDLTLIAGGPGGPSSINKAWITYNIGAFQLSLDPRIRRNSVLDAALQRINDGWISMFERVNDEIAMKIARKVKKSINSTYLYA